MIHSCYFILSIICLTFVPVDSRNEILARDLNNFDNYVTSMNKYKSMWLDFNQLLNNGQMNAGTIKMFADRHFHDNISVSISKNDPHHRISISGKNNVVKLILDTISEYKISNIQNILSPYACTYRNQSTSSSNNFISRSSQHSSEVHRTVNPESDKLMLAKGPMLVVSDEHFWTFSQTGLQISPSFARMSMLWVPDDWSHKLWILRKVSISGVIINGHPFDLRNVIDLQNCVDSNIDEMK